MKKIIQILAVLVSVITLPVHSQTYLTQVKPAGKSWGYANQKGEVIIPAQYIRCYKFSSEGFAAIYDAKEHQYIFINTKGEKMNTEIKEFKLRDGLGLDVEGFKSGRALIKQGVKWGYFDTNGKIAIAAKYEDANDFCDGFAAAKNDGKFVVLNIKGEEIPVEAESVIEVKDFSEGLAPFKTSYKRLGFINTSGKVAIQPQYESVGYFKNGLAWAKEPGGLLGYINPKGEWVIKPQFAGGRDFDKESGLARVKNGERWAYVNKAGELMYVTDAITWGDFSEGLAEGKKGVKKGFYNNKGVWVIQPQFDATRDFKNGFAAAKMGDKWGMINKEGKWVIQPTFDGIKDMEAIK
ncbi:MAG: WG repeat-containing protein [Bacteroidota bacterium]